MNLKKYYKDLLESSSELTAKLGSGKILSAYPQEVKIFPLVVFEDMSSNDVAFSDNLPEGTNAQVRIHIFTKTLAKYPTTYEIADIIHQLFRADFWAMTNNTETGDVDDNIRHRIMDFTRAFYAL